MNCSDVAKYVEVYVDGEFDQREREELEAHVVACEPCRGLVKAEREFRSALKNTLSPTEAPEHLRQSICDRIDQAARSEAGSRLRNTLIPLAAAAAIALVAWWPFSQPSGAQSSPVAAGALNVPATSARPAVAPPKAAARPPRGPRVPINATFASYSPLPADVAGSEPDIQRYMKARVPFAVRAPLGEAATLRLAGARQLNDGGTPRVLFIYLVGGERLEIIQSAATPAEAADPGLVLERHGTLTMGRYVRDGLTHILRTELPPGDLARLLQSAAR